MCLQPHIEGLLAQGAQGLHVGDKIRAKLTRTDVQHGFIDFVKAVEADADASCNRITYAE